MKQVLQDRSGATSVRDVPSPACPSAGALVRTSFSAISSGTERTRVEVSQKSLLGKARERPDLVRQVIDKARTEGISSTRAAVKNKLSVETPIGYSSAGIVTEVGSEAAGVRVGDRVACAGGGHANHAEICAMPRNLMAKVPDDISLATASITTIGAISLHGIRLAEPTLGERVAVIGAGLVGQIACRLLQAQGVEVFAVDLDPTRVQYAVDHGADHGFVVNESTASKIRELTGGIGVDRVLVTAGSSRPEPLVLGAEIVRDRGSLILVGAVPIEIPRAPLYNKEVHFRVSRSYGPGRYDPEYEERGLDYPIGYVRWTEQRNMEAILELQARGQIELDDLVDEVFPAEEADVAYSRLVDEDVSRRPLGAFVLSYGQPDDRAQPDKPVVGAPHLSARSIEPVEGAVRLGLIGPGGFASRILLPAFIDAGVKLETVGGGNGPSAEAAVREKGFVRAAGSGPEVCEDPEVDVVVVATRHGSHAELTRSALAAGKHVFCEKPLALSAEQLDGVMDAAASSGRVLAVGFNRRFAPMVRRVREHISEFGGPITATFRVSAGQVPGDHWVHDLEQGGGRILGEGCHFIDTLRYLVGEPIVEVSAIAHGAVNTPLQTHDRALISVTFADGSIGSVAYVGQGSPKVGKERLEVFGNGGRSAILDDYRQLDLFDGRKVTSESAKSQDKGHRAEIAAFIGAVQGRDQPVSLLEIAEVSSATIGVIRSLETGSPVRVNPVG